MFTKRAKAETTLEAGEPAPDDQIVLREVGKSYRHGAAETFVLRRVSAAIHDGEFVSIMGPSGAGKSTLLHILGMYDDDYLGEVHHFGNPIHTMSRKERAELQKSSVGFVFQNYHLLDELTVFENIEIPLTYRNVPRKEREARVCDILDQFQIVGKRDLFPSQLSGGQQQLVGVARAMVASPRLILADEPTGNLHSRQAHEIMEMFRRLNEAGTTIVQVTHSDELARYGDRIIELRDGWVVTETGRHVANRT